MEEENAALRKENASLLADLQRLSKPREAISVESQPIDASALAQQVSQMKSQMTFALEQLKSVHLLLCY